MIQLFFCSLLLFVSSAVLAKPLVIQVDAPNAVLMDAKTGTVLFEKGGRVPIFPASTTKVASALYVLKMIPDRLDEKVVCPPEALKRTTENEKKNSNYTISAHLLEIDGIMLGLRPKEVLTVRELLEASLISSRNDAINVLACYVSGDLDTFMKGVNEMAKEIGCTNSHFSNAHGLHQPDLVSTAYDMALLTREALKNPIFREIVGREKCSLPKNGTSPPKEYGQTNALLRKNSKFYYPKAIGVKTGYHKKAKKNLIAAAVDETRELIAVVHQVPTIRQACLDVTRMFEVAFQEKKQTRLLFRAAESTYEKRIPKAKTRLIGELREDLFLTYFPSEESVLKAALLWNELSLPIDKGDEVGRLSVVDVNGAEVLSSPLFAKERVSKRFFFKVVEIVPWKTLLTITLLSGIALLYFEIQRKKKVGR